MTINRVSYCLRCIPGNGTEIQMDTIQYQSIK